MESLKIKILCEYKNKKCVYYNTEIAKRELKYAKEVLINNLNKKQLNLFDTYKNLLEVYKKELINEVFEFVFDYVECKLELK